MDATLAGSAASDWATCGGTPESGGGSPPTLLNAEATALSFRAGKEIWVRLHLTRHALRNHLRPPHTRTIGGRRDRGQRHLRSADVLLTASGRQFQVHPVSAPWEHQLATSRGPCSSRPT